MVKMSTVGVGRGQWRGGGKDMNCVKIEHSEV